MGGQPMIVSCSSKSKLLMSTMPIVEPKKLRTLINYALGISSRIDGLHSNKHDYR